MALAGWLDPARAGRPNTATGWKLCEGQCAACSLLVVQQAGWRQGTAGRVAARCSGSPWCSCMERGCRGGEAAGGSIASVGGHHRRQRAGKEAVQHSCSKRSGWRCINMRPCMHNPCMCNFPLGLAEGMAPSSSLPGQRAGVPRCLFEVGNQWAGVPPVHVGLAHDDATGR